MKVAWPTCLLKDVCNFQNGYAFRNRDYVDESSDAYEVFRMGHICRGGGFNPDASKVFFPKSKAEKLERFILQKNDILMSMTDMKASMALLGHTALLPAGGRFLLNQRVGRITVRDGERMNFRFLYYYTNTQEAVQYLRSRANSGVQVNLTTTVIKECPVPLPPLPTQRKIAAILSAYDDLIENNLRRIELLEEMAQNLFREWFVKFRFPGHEHARFVDSPLGRIPEGWEVASLGKLAELRKDKFKEELHSQRPLLNLAKMQQRTLVVSKMGSSDELTTSRIIFEEDDILFGSIRPYLHKVALAPCRGVTNVSVLVIRPAEKSLQSFLAVLLSSIDAIRWADQHSTGTKMPVIKWDALRTMPVLLPPQSVLQFFEAIVQPMLQTIKVTFPRNRNLRRTRDLLLPRLVSGEMDVSELDIAVPGEAGT